MGKIKVIIKKKVIITINRIKRIVKRLFEILSEPQMLFLPAHIAFFLVLSIFPILTLIGFITSFFSIDINSLTNIMNNAIPPSVTVIFTQFIEGSGLTSNLGLLILIGFFLASNGTHAIILASNSLYNFPNSTYLNRRVKAFFLIFLLIVLFVFLLVVLAFGNNIVSFIKSFIHDDLSLKIINFLYLLLKWPIASFILYFNIKLIYTISPDWKIMSKNTTKGAIFTTIGWIVATYIYSFYVTNFSTYDKFYGNLSNIAILMLWIYIISYILVIGIGINAKLYTYNNENDTQ